MWTVLDALVIDATVWTPPGRCTLVLGALDCTGSVVVTPPQGARYAELIVLGPLRCRNLGVGDDSALICAGPVTVREVMVTDTCDSVTELAGELRAGMCVGAVTFADGGAEVLSELSVEHLRRDALDEDDEIDGRHCCRLLLTGESLLR